MITIPLPTPNKGESESDFVGRCMNNAQARSDFPQQKQRSAVCFSQFRKARGKQMKNKATISEPTAANEKYHIEYYTEISHDESSTDGDSKDFIIQGTAIEETISRNDMEYKAVELEKAVNSLVDVPLLKDHNNSVDSIIGRVTDARFEDRKVLFKAKIMDSSMQEKIRAGLIKHVSIGSDIEKITTATTNNRKHFVAQGIEFLELSLVAVPGVANATFDHAISEAYNSMKEKKMEEDRMAKLEKALEAITARLTEQDEPTPEEPTPAEPEEDTPEDGETEEEENTDDDSAERINTLTKDIRTLRKELSNVTKEMAKSKARTAETVNVLPEWQLNEPKADKFGNISAEWNPEYFNIYD